MAGIFPDKTQHSMPLFSSALSSPNVLIYQIGCAYSDNGTEFKGTDFQRQPQKSHHMQTEFTMSFTNSSLKPPFQIPASSKPE